MTTPHFLPYGRQSISQDDIDQVAQALKSAIITRGSHVDEFEQAIADYCRAAYAVAFNSGSTALLAAYHAAQVSPYDRIISTPNTFAASVGSGMVNGAQPVFVDIDRNTGNIDLNLLEIAFKESRSTRGKSIVTPVHFAGIPVDMKKLNRMIRDPETVVIEDAAHALGSTYADGQKVGCCAWSQMTVFSFHPVKTITTGEGGMVLTNDVDLFHSLRLFRNNGIEKDPAYWEMDLANAYEGYYEIVELTSNYNFTDLQAALGLSQLKRIEMFVTKRRELIKEYRELLKGMPGIRMFDPAVDVLTAFHICVVQIEFDAYNTTRQHVIHALRQAGIGTQVHYIPVYHHPAFKKAGVDLSEQFPNMEGYYAEALTLPLYHELSSEDVGRVVNTLKDILVEQRQKRHQKKKKR